MTSLQTSHDDDELDISLYDVERLRTLADANGVLYWNLKGAWGKVPNAMLVNAIAAYDQLRALSGRREWVEERYGWIIHWEQTVDVREPARASQAPLLTRTQP